MSTVGNASRWSPVFPPKLVPRVIKLVITCWDDFEVTNRHELEVPLARRFRSLLRQEGLIKRLPVAIDREIPEDDEAGEERGRIDLRFLHGFDTNAYFAFECKRLNVPKRKGNGRKTLAPEYVDQGVMRFVSGQYAKTVTQGGMIGFVMDGQMQDAITSVGAALRRKGKILKMRRPYSLSVSLHFPKEVRIKESYHAISQGTFRVHHVFLAAG